MVQAQVNVSTGFAGEYRIQAYISQIFRLSLDPNYTGALTTNHRALVQFLGLEKVEDCCSGKVWLLAASMAALDIM